MEKNIEQVKEWIDNNVSYYDPSDFDYNYTVEQAIADMLYDIKCDFLKLDLDDDIDNEEEIIEYFKNEWNAYFK